MSTAFPWPWIVEDATEGAGVEPNESLFLETTIRSSRGATVWSTASWKLVHSSKITGTLRLGGRPRRFTITFDHAASPRKITCDIPAPEAGDDSGGGSGAAESWTAREGAG